MIDREQLDVLLFVREHRGKGLSARTVAQAVHLSAASTEQHLARLCGRGFLTVTLGTDLLYAYEPTPALENTLQELDERFRSS